MINPVRLTIDVLIRVFELGLFISIVLNWIRPPPLLELRRFLNLFYDVFLNPMRRHLPPVRLSADAPSALDLTPLILLLLVWWLVHPFFMWLLH